MILRLSSAGQALRTWWRDDRANYAFQHPCQLCASPTSEPCGRYGGDGLNRVAQTGTPDAVASTNGEKRVWKV
jgi:hypothetical protein